MWSSSKGTARRLAGAAIGLLGLCWATAAAQTAGPLVPVRVALNPALYAYLPFELAADKGYFAAQNIDLKVTTYNGSATTVMPIVARGDLDITPQVAGPALFNQQQQGFDVKIICSINQGHPGWAGDIWVLVRQDLWDAGTIRSLNDLRGRAIGGGPDGGAGGFVLSQALAKAGLTRANVQYSTRLSSPADMFAALTNKGTDVVAVAEPLATEIETRGTGKKLVSNFDVAPWLQETYFVASAKYIREHPAVVVSFLKAYLKGASEVTAAHGKWTPELVSVVAKWTGMPVETINKLKGPSYAGQLGEINRLSLEREQDYFANLGLIKTKIDVNTLIDDGPLRQARKELNIR